MALPLLPDADVGLQSRGVHRALPDSARSGPAVSMHRRTCRGPMRWRQGCCPEHRRRLPLLQRDTAQGKEPCGCCDLRVSCAFEAGQRQMAPITGQRGFHRTKGCPRTDAMSIIRHWPSALRFRRELSCTTVPRECMTILSYKNCGDRISQTISDACEGVEKP